MYFIHNINVADPVKRTLHHKTQIGSVCVLSFGIVRQRGLVAVMETIHRYTVHKTVSELIIILPTTF